MVFVELALVWRHFVLLAMLHRQRHFLGQRHHNRHCMVPHQALAPFYGLESEHNPPKLVKLWIKRVLQRLVFVVSMQKNDVSRSLMGRWAFPRKNGLQKTQFSFLALRTRLSLTVRGSCYCKRHSQNHYFVTASLLVLLMRSDDAPFDVSVF